MQSVRRLLGITGLTLLCAGAQAAAGAFDFQLVVDDQTAIPGTISYEFSTHVVAGTGGTFATIAFSDSIPYIMLHPSGNPGGTAVLTTPGDGFTEMLELGFSPSAGKLTFVANNAGDNYTLHQIGLTRDPMVPLTPINSETLKITNFQPLDETHYQVNASGTVVYKYRNGGTVQTFATVGAVNNTVAEGDSHGLEDFNLPVNGLYRRQAIASDNTVVFFARNDVTSVPAIYRLNTAGVATPIITTGVTTDTRVIGASSNAVLLVNKPISTQATLSLQVGAAAPITLASYTDDGSRALATNAVMTQQNRVAYYDPGNAVGDASVGYYQTLQGDLTVAGEGDTITDGADTFTIQQITINNQLKTNPMVNDNGFVAFDAILTNSDPTPAEVHALLVWDAGTQQTRVVVKADQDIDNDGIYTYSDQFNGFDIIALDFDVATNLAGDVLKDALSDDNFLAFTMVYYDEVNDVQHNGVAMVQVPEPAMTGALLVGAGMLLRRRRNECKQ